MSHLFHATRARLAHTKGEMTLSHTHTLSLEVWLSVDALAQEVHQDEDGGGRGAQARLFLTSGRDEFSPVG